MDARTRTRIKVTLTYLGIIMLMSITFTWVIYNVSNRELYRVRNVPLPQDIRNFFTPDDFNTLRDKRLTESQESLRNRLILFNVFTLLIGAGISYLLALRSLAPIEEALERQDRFTSDASHEMRTPLTIMKGDIEISLRDPKLTLKEAKETLISNLEEVNKLEALTGGLLQLARQENTELPKEKIEINILLKEAKDHVKKPARDKKIKINLPELKNEFIVVEPDSLRQAIVIFLDNAIKYSPEKSEVEIVYKSQRTNHCIKIIDHGQGIAEKDLEHIFERFYRVDQSRTKTESTKGYGLGLSIAKQIVDAQGGHINIKSKLNHGTEVTISIPKK